MGFGDELDEQQREEEVEDSEALRDSELVRSLSEDPIEGEEQKLRKWLAKHQPMGNKFDKYFSGNVRLSNLDMEANRRMQSHYVVLLLSENLGARARVFTDFMHAVITAESDVYAATGPGRERVMQTTSRAELVRENKGLGREGGIKSRLNVPGLR